MATTHTRINHESEDDDDREGGREERWWRKAGWRLLLMDAIWMNHEWSASVLLSMPFPSCSAFLLIHSLVLFLLLFFIYLNQQESSEFLERKILQPTWVIAAVGPVIPGTILPYHHLTNKCHLISVTMRKWLSWLRSELSLLQPATGKSYASLPVASFPSTKIVPQITCWCHDKD